MMPLAHDISDSAQQVDLIQTLKNQRFTAFAVQFQQVNRGAALPFEYMEDVDRGNGANPARCVAGH